MLEMTFCAQIHRMLLLGTFELLLLTSYVEMYGNGCFDFDLAAILAAHISLPLSEKRPAKDSTSGILSFAGRFCLFRLAPSKVKAPISRKFFLCYW